MKRLFLSLMLLTLLSGVAVAKDSFSSMSEAQIKTLVCHKWKLTYLEFKGKKKEIPAKLPASLLIFLTDGNLQEFEGSKKYDGKWTYNHSTKTVVTVDKDGTENHKIINLTDDEFVMNGKYQGFTFNMGFKRLD